MLAKTINYFLNVGMVVLVSIMIFYSAVSTKRLLSETGSAVVYVIDNCESDYSLLDVTTAIGK